MTCPGPSLLCPATTAPTRSFFLDGCPGSPGLTRKPGVQRTGLSLCVPEEHWAGRVKTQEAKPGEVLHVEKKTGGSLRAFLLAVLVPGV